MEPLDATHLVGIGRTAEVHAWSAGRVLKLFHPGVPAARVEHERRITAAAHAAGHPAPAVFERVERAGRHGFVMERVEGPSLLADLQRRPWRAVAVGRQLAEVQAALHSRPVPGLPSLSEKLGRRIAAAALPEPLRARAEAALARLPAGEALCHGDLHPDNVVLTPGGPVVIDWSEATRGHPLADVARTSLMLRIGSPPHGAFGVLLNAGRRVLDGAYLARILALTGSPRGALEPFLLPIAAARAEERIEDERAALLGILERLAR
jgi:aminoglycoside phosphotransferase (APT) family kinase protein